METEKKLNQDTEHQQNTDSKELLEQKKQQAFNKMMLLKRAIEQAEKKQSQK